MGNMLASLVGISSQIPRQCCSMEGFILIRSTFSPLAKDSTERFVPYTALLSYFTCSSFLFHCSRKYYLDKCFTQPMPPEIFQKTENLVDMVVKGHNAAAIMMEIG